MQAALVTLGVDSDMDLSMRVLDALCSMEGKYVEVTQVRAIVHSPTFPVRTGDVKAVLARLRGLVNSHCTERNEFFSCTYAIISAAALERLTAEMDTLLDGHGVDGRAPGLQERLAARLCVDHTGRATFARLSAQVASLQRRIDEVANLGNT
jgi:hypothetical protein